MALFSFPRIASNNVAAIVLSPLERERDVVGHSSHASGLSRKYIYKPRRHLNDILVLSKAGHGHSFSRDKAAI
jgi:hypothetical protein